MNTSCESQAENVPILAVSGGIDSMTLMWMYRDRPNVIVAHFNHGTRPSSDDDEAFVRRAANNYGLKFISEKATLGENISEAEARAARYCFLNRVAKAYNGKIYVAHHSDDVIESIAINLLRGTGWRGLAVMGNQKVVRPMLSMDKKEIYQLAVDKNLTFRQDPTNTEDTYLRNRVRKVLRFLPKESKTRLKTIHNRQNELVHEIDLCINSLLPKDRVYQRAWFSDLDDEVALEILRAALLRSNISTTRPQIQDFLNAIRSYAPEKSFNLPGNHLIKLHKTYFVI